MAQIQRAISDDIFRHIAQAYGTPIFVYDENGIRSRIKNLNQAFNWAKVYVNYFAVKATPTPAILRIMADEGLGFDCSSLSELQLITESDLLKSKLFFTANNVSDEDYYQAHSRGAIINLDKLADLENILKVLPDVPQTMSIRYNPGQSIIGSNSILGNPKYSKFGDSKANVLIALKRMQSAGVTNIGLHSMLVSNQVHVSGFEQTAQYLKNLILEVSHKLGLKINFVNLGGGLGMNYQHKDQPVNLQAISQAIKNILGDLDIPIYTEFGRYITASNGYLLTRITHSPITSHQTFLPVDTSVNNLNRLATVDDAYHELSILGEQTLSETIPMTVVGSMCTDTDKLFSNRLLPKNTKKGDLLVIHDVGAHGRADATNYNGSLRCGEVIVQIDNTCRLIRRHETIDDLLATTEDF
ncbi:MAG: diaminopimelate decarboxylase [Candidatus Saccharibacteria bacterium]|nr:diaminopimelate decarboxylase [Candidatus Saccharibacteria bacterium]